MGQAETRQAIVRSNGSQRDWLKAISKRRQAWREQIGATWDLAGKSKTIEG
jgi:hypothetical protein